MVEPVEPQESQLEAGKVVKLATWVDANRGSLAPHDPEPTDVVIPFESGSTDRKG